MTASPTLCACLDVPHLEGADAAAYAESHLRLVSFDPETWEAKYSCPQTGTIWTMSYPHSELHGGGPPVLDRDPHAG